MTSKRLDRGPLAWLVLVLLAATSQGRAEDPYQVTWARQLGTSGHDYAYGAALSPTGGVYITGPAAPGIDGAGGTGSYLARYDAGGTQLWCRQSMFPPGNTFTWTSEFSPLAVDADGNAYLTGQTRNTPGGSFQKGCEDGFLAKYDAGGNLLWSRQFGVAGVDEEGLGVTVDMTGNSYVCGYTTVAADTRNGVVKKYSTDGTELLSWQISTPEDNVAK